MSDPAMTTEELRNVTGRDQHPDETEDQYRYRMMYALALGPRPVHSRLARWLNTGDPSEKHIADLERVAEPAHRALNDGEDDG